MTRLISSGSPWEAELGYSRAVVSGGFVFVSGSSGLVRGGADAGTAAEQLTVAIGKIEAALAEAGCTLADVVSTRVYLTDEADWEEVGRAHGSVFRDIRPALSMVQVARLIDPLMKIEIEAVAVATAMPVVSAVSATRTEGDRA
ncbi:RidA family protein [Glaciihabitans sp. dw_435]|uniref:RidA family protein n=1 Tax=Glaciihabitans sp. dw_435 TaxID=2720081 RepID=UPI001BD46466|nr:RidA family protein [Glaciihabitans sp. dw_435]